VRVFLTLYNINRRREYDEKNAKHNPTEPLFEQFEWASSFADGAKSFSANDEGMAERFCELFLPVE
jgi:hypothetical protein